MDIWISFGNDKGKSRVQITIANVACEPRTRPTFVFLSFPKEIPNYEHKQVVSNVVI